MTSPSAAVVHGMAASAGAVLAAGVVSVQPIPNEGGAWAVRRSLDNGVTWQSVDMFALENGTSAAAAALAIATDGDQTFYAVGASIRHPPPSFFERHWIVRKSPDNGQTWSTVQDRTDFGTAAGVALDRVGGHVYVTGFRFTGTTNASVWMTERSDDGGATWSIVDTFNDGGNGAESRAIVAGPSGDIFVAGFSYDTLGATNWIVRHSPSGLAGTWTTVDSYRLTPGKSAIVRAGTVDSLGNIVFTGIALDSAQNQHWITRTASVASPTSWTTIDDFNAGSGDFAVGAAGVTFGLKGDLFVTGGIKGTDGSFYYQTRRGSLQAGSFSLFDSVKGTHAFVGGASGGSAAVTTPDGSIFTGGGLYDAAKGLEWVVRKLGCE